MSATFAAIVLAAGASRRLGRPKQLIEIAGISLVRRAVLAALTTSPERTLVVVGAWSNDVFASVSDLPVERVDAICPEEGMAASLRSGVHALGTTQVDGVMLVVSDQLDLDASHLLALWAVWSAAPDKASASAYAGAIGVPAILPRSWFPQLLQLRGDRGARDLLRARPSDVVATDSPSLVRDLDSAADLP